MRKRTPATPTLSAAEAARVTVPDTVAPLAGDFIATVAGVGPGVGALLPVTVPAAEVRVLPAASRAMAVSVCVPLAMPAVFHETEYGALVSSAPRFVPSTRKRTPATPTL